MIEVRRKYGLTVDRREADEREHALLAGPLTEMVAGECAPAAEPSARRLSAPAGDPLELHGGRKSAVAAPA